MEKKRNLNGTGVALVTPFKKDKSPDYDSLKKLVNHVSKGGVDFLVVMGTTAESATLSTGEKKTVIEEVHKYNEKELPVVIGIGGNNTNVVIDQIANMDIDKADAILSVVPYYNKPSQEGIYQHFKTIAGSTDKDIILYNVPGRTGADMSAATCIRLANDFKNIVAVKEASGNFDKAMEIIMNKPADFSVMSGEDAISLPLISAGMNGVISVVANAFPYEWSEMVAAARAGNLNEARLLHYHLLRITGMMFAEGNPSGVKATLEQLGIVENNLRLPLVPVSEELYSKIGSEIARIQLAK